MPLSRYEIRNEYSLADPDLYRAADKDDPEALLEGVAMAGLVGVLRQLGDLAEFAAEIFHNLHEEVMATAARGHDLMIRVEQLETEVPSIEIAFLSQTDHSSFFYHAGVDWHPNLHIDQNLVTRGDLPRFIMDSYEECRAPPRLFLLDKFDVAGAGACLKRYTDPSFFKVETTGTTRADVQREKKTRKAKKKGPRWRYGETPEVLPASHAKLHQLFLEEHVANGVSNPSRRAKLKRRLNGFPFDTKTGKSYMEKLLRSSSPDRKVLHEVTINPSPLMLAANEHNESGLEVPEVRPVVRPASPDRESVGSKRSPPSPDREEIMLTPSMYVPREVPIDDKFCEVPDSNPTIATDDISSSLDEMSGEKVIPMDVESNREGSLTGYQSDDVASEVDNYVDAPSTIESEMDTDSELRGKSDFTSPHKKTQPLIMDPYEELFHTQSSDSQSTGDSTMSDKRNNFSREEMSSFSSDSPSTSAENPQSEKKCANGFPSADIPDIEIVDDVSYQKTADEDFHVDQLSKPVASDDTCIGTDAITNYGPEFVLLTSSFCNNESIAASAHSDSAGVETKVMSVGPESDEMASTVDGEEKKRSLVMYPQCSPCVSDIQLQSGDDSPRSSASEHLVDERNGGTVSCISIVPDVHSHPTDNSVNISLDLVHEDESDREDRNMVKNTSSTSDMFSQNTNGTPGIISSEDLIPPKLDDELPELPENSPSDHIGIAHNENNIESAVSKGETPIDELDYGDSNVSAESAHCSSSAYFQTVDAEDNSSSCVANQIRSENSILLHLADSPDWPQAGLNDHEGDVIPEKETTVIESIVLGTSNDSEALENSCPPEDIAQPAETSDTVELDSITLCTISTGREITEILGSAVNESIVHETSNDSEAFENSCPPEDIAQPAGTSDTVEMDADAITRCTSSTGREVTEILGSADLKSMNEVHVLANESDSEAPESNTAEMASDVPAISGNVIIDNAHLSAGLNTLAEERIHCFDNSGLNELENDKNCLSGSHGESDLVKKVDQTEAATSAFGTVFCNTVDNDHPKSDASDTVPDSHLDLEADHGFEFVHAATIQSLDQRGLDKEQENFPRSGVGNHVADAPSLQVDYDTEASIIQEKVGLPRSQPDQELLQSAEISSELSPMLPVDHQEMLDHDNHEGEDISASPFTLVNRQSPHLVSELPRPSNYDVGLPGHPNDPLPSIFPPSNPFSETNQINLADLPPLPPLPPVQWRMAKLQHVSSSTDGQTMKHKELFPQLISPPTTTTNDVSSSPSTVSTDDVGSSPPNASTSDVGSCPPDASSDDVGSCPPDASSTEGQTMNHKELFPQLMSPPTIFTNDVSSSPSTVSTDDVGSFLPNASTNDVGSCPPDASTDAVGSCTLDASSTEVHTMKHKELFPQLISPPTTSTNDVSSSPSTVSTDDVGSSLPNASTDDVGSCPPNASTDDVRSSPLTTSTVDVGSSPPTASTDDVRSSQPTTYSDNVGSSPPTALLNDISSSLEETKHSLIKISETASKEEKAENSCSSLEANVMQETIDLPPKIEYKQQQFAMPTSESELSSPAEEDGVANGSRTVKLPRPRNPLIDDVAVLDKSKLRKVTERVRPQIQKVDERDSLLEQIRTKSFNLKPAMASRPSTRGPNTNLKVAAILEKANAIRQALAGSDEDDEDSWSDS